LTKCAYHASFGLAGISAGRQGTTAGHIARDFPDGLTPTAVVGLSDNSITILGISKHFYAPSWLGGSSVEPLPTGQSPHLVMALHPAARAATVLRHVGAPGDA